MQELDKPVPIKPTMKVPRAVIPDETKDETDDEPDDDYGGDILGASDECHWK